MKLIYNVKTKLVQVKGLKKKKLQLSSKQYH